MRKRFHLSIVIILLAVSQLIVSCGLFTSDNPCAKHIDRRTMANLLSEIFLLEAIISNQTHDKGMTDSIAYYYAGIFEKYNVTPQQFEKAFSCYMLDTQHMTWVMDEALSAISIAQSKIDEKKEDHQ